MNIEKTIRERHAFTDRVKQFLTLASSMTDRELETALGRLADMLQTDPNPEHVKVRGEILKLYYDMRLRGEKKYRRFKRVLNSLVPGMEPYDYRIDKSDSDYFVRPIATFTLLSGNCLAPPPAERDKPMTETVKLLAP